MNINELFELANHANIENLKPLKDVQESDYIHFTGENELTISYNMVAEKYDTEIADKTYMLIGGLPTVVYFDKETYVLLDLMNFILMNATLEQLQKQIKEVTSLIEKEGLTSPMVEIRIPSQFKTSLLAYYMKHQKIESYEDFIRFYIHSEYGFSQLPKDKIKQILQDSDKKYGQEIIDTLPDEVVIYRGMGDKSTSVDEALSWTLDKNIAYFFVNKSNETAYIYTVKVKKKDILAYINDRDEEEVLVLPENVNLINKTRLYSYADITTEFDVEFFEVVSGYQNLLIQYRPLLDCLIDRVGHGVSHVQRVCVLGGLLYQLQENEFDNNLIAIMIAGLLHDIGRVDDGIDKGHGRRSADLFLKYQSQFNSSITKLDEFIATLIAYHDLEDNEFIEYIKERHFNNKEDLLVCWKFLKDADELDRVRFGFKNLDVNYLRNDISKELVLFAHQLLKVQMDIEE